MARYLSKCALKSWRLFPLSSAKKRPMNAHAVKSAKGRVSGDLNEKSVFLKQVKIRTIMIDP